MEGIKIGSKKVHVISSGDRKRELIEVTQLPKGKKHSRTFHQTLIGSGWIDNADIKKRSNHARKR